MSDELDLTDDTARVESILRSMSDGDLELETPPASVWAGIEAALAATPATRETEEPLAPVIDLAARRRPLLVGAVAAALVVIAGLALVFVSDDDSSPVEVASADLVYLDDPGFVDLGIGRSAGVTLVEKADTEAVRVDVADLPAAGDDNDLEIWLIGVTDGEIEVIQPLGIVADPTDPGTFSVPADFDRTAYDSVLVDISLEPHDGNEAHSGMSLIRGPITT